jgi:hypothetical protein
MTGLSYDFQVLFASHATNSNVYVVDAFLQINDECGDEISTDACDCVIEDCDAPNNFSFYTGDDVYQLKCKWEDNNLHYEAFKNGEVMSEDTYTISDNRFKADLDDPIWKVLGYDKENESDDE